MRTQTPHPRRSLLAALCCAIVAALLAATTPRAWMEPESGVAAGVTGGEVIARVLDHYAAETAGIDATLHAVTDRRDADALIDASRRGVPVRLVTAAALYRDPGHARHAWNVDRLHRAGVEVRHLRQAGPLHETLTVLHGQGLVVLGSSGGIAPGAHEPAAYAYVGGSPWMYAWAAERFNRLWHNGGGHEETLAFTPLPPDMPRLYAPADSAADQPAAVTLRWQPGPWAHRYDVYVGTSPGSLVPVARDVALDDVDHLPEVIGWRLADLAADTVYYWQVVSRTMATVERAGPVWSFRTGSSAAPEPAGPPRRAAVRSPSAATTDADSGTAPESVDLLTLAQRRPPRGEYTGRVAIPRPPEVRPAVDMPPAAHPPPPAAPPGSDPPGVSLPDSDAGGFSSDDSAVGELVSDDGISTTPAPAPASPGYPGREAEAAWRQEALERIERIRKSDIELRIVDAEGRPIEGAEVRLEMTRHRFGFGSAVTAHDLTADTDDARQYRQLVERSFNRVVFENDLKWHNWVSPTISFYNRDQTYRALEWLNSRDIDVRGHYVIWGRLTGDRRLEWYGALEPDDFRAALLRDAREIVTAIGGRVREWDVVNHSNGRDEGTLLERLGDQFYDDVFRGVAEWQPDVGRYINEGDVLSGTRINRDRYYELIAQMLSRGAPLQGIGMMGHFFADRELVSPEELLEVFDRYGHFGLPLQVTEFDFWTTDEALQGDFTRDFLIAAFSHPAVESVVMWGFWEGRHWHPAAALYRRDWSAKPNGLAWEDLVRRQWWTRHQGVTTSAGVYRERGFHGTYHLEVERAEGPVSCRFVLGPDGFEGLLVLDDERLLPPTVSARGGVEFTCELPR